MKLKNLFKPLYCKHPNGFIFVKNVHGDEINQLSTDSMIVRSIWLCPDCHKVIYSPKLYDLGNYSDGYHTFDELYHHRAILFAVICHVYKDLCWKSLKHADDLMYDDMFIVGIDTPEGPATYHYDMNYWNLFDVKEIPCAPSWDGHTSNDAIDRISSLLKYMPGEIGIIDLNELSNSTIDCRAESVDCSKCRKSSEKKTNKNSLFKRIFDLF